MRLMGLILRLELNLELSGRLPIFLNIESVLFSDKENLKINNVEPNVYRSPFFI